MRLRYISTVEPLHNGHHWHFVHYSKVVSNSGVFSIFLVGVVLRNLAVEYNMAAFQSFPLLHAGREG